MSNEESSYVRRLIYSIRSKPMLLPYLVSPYRDCLCDQGSVSQRLRSTKSDLNYGRPFMPLVPLTIPGIGISRDVQIVVTNLWNLHFYIPLLKEKTLSKDHNWETNGESNQWHEWPAIYKSILFFVRHPHLVSTIICWYLKGLLFPIAQYINVYKNNYLSNPSNCKSDTCVMYLLQASGYHRWRIRRVLQIFHQGDGCTHG